MADERRHARLGEPHLRKERWDTRPMRAEDVQPGRIPVKRKQGGCESPSFIPVAVEGAVHPDGRQIYQRVEVSCSKCRHCREVRRSSIAAAVFSEVQSAAWAFFLTLTVSPAAVVDHPLMDCVLEASYPQNFLKRFRSNAARGLASCKGRSVGPSRFIMCGELGKLNGRAHYHVLIWGSGDAPAWPEGRVEEFPEWRYPFGDGADRHYRSFGHVFVVGNVDETHARYVTKYLTKSDAQRGTDFIMSRSQSVGAEAAYQRGFALASMGATVPTHSFTWSRRDVAGKLRSALMRGAQRRWFLKGFMDGSGMTLDDLFQVMPFETHGELRRIAREEAERALKVVSDDEFLDEFRESLRRGSEEQFRDERERSGRRYPAARPEPRWTPEREGDILPVDAAADNERLRRKWAAEGRERDGGRREP